MDEKPSGIYTIPLRLRNGQARSAKNEAHEIYKFGEAVLQQ
jgi:hypothetical protein